MPDDPTDEQMLDLCERIIYKQDLEYASHWIDKYGVKMNWYSKALGNLLTNNSFLNGNCPWGGVLIT